MDVPECILDNYTINFNTLVHNFCCHHRESYDSVVAKREWVHAELIEWWQTGVHYWWLIFILVIEVCSAHKTGGKERPEGIQIQTVIMMISRTVQFIRMEPDNNDAAVRPDGWNVDRRRSGLMEWPRRSVTDSRERRIRGHAMGKRWEGWRATTPRDHEWSSMDRWPGRKKGLAWSTTTLRQDAYTLKTSTVHTRSSARTLLRRLGIFRGGPTGHTATRRENHTRYGRHNSLGRRAIAGKTARRSRRPLCSVV